MRQYEVAIRIAQVHHLADEKKYKKALKVIQTLDMRQVRNISDLKVFADVYTKTEQFDAAKATYLRIYKKSRTKRVLYRLIYLAIRTGELGEAEDYYQEFIRMNPSNRDILILRYCIDKAAGVPVGQLIDILKTLKDEEYIEEWAYELAKLYHQAGRLAECREECEDIILWFGSGEIVERAKLLLEHIAERDPLPFFDDTDFTDREKEKPNPDDTGSLPDLNEYLQSSSEEEMRLLKKVDPEKFEEIESELIEQETEEQQESASEEAVENVQTSAGEFEDDYEKELNIEEHSQIQPDAYPKVSQSGTGITQDLAKEISAIYEAEHREQLKEKAVTVIHELPNKASEVMERMTEAVHTKEYIPLDIEEIYQEEDLSAKTVVIPDVSKELEDTKKKAVVSAEAALLEALEAEVAEAELVAEKETAEQGNEEKPEEDIMLEGTTSDRQGNEDILPTAAEEQKETLQEDIAATEEPSSKAANSEIMESATGETLPEKDLPTTRALHRSFSDILILIGGELDPSHFVLMGDGTERIVGISKKIAVVMRESGFLSSGRIAHIDAVQLNQMDLIKFKTQLKGNCLLITHAAELLFPTITKVFSIMDEYYGDFAVILSDEGATLDQLFRFVPALARRFKYIIDISQYTEQDYS